MQRRKPLRLEMFRTRTVEKACSFWGISCRASFIYDWILEKEDWRVAVDLLAASPGHPCILLASRAVDNYLWEELLRRGGFDVIPRSATVECLAGNIRFACFSLRRSPLSREPQS
jgi:hypothetical protein